MKIEKYIFSFVCGAAGESEASLPNFWKLEIWKPTLKAWQPCIYKGGSGFYVEAELSFDKIKLSKSLAK